MKLIITESKRNRAITKWLSENYNNLHKVTFENYNVTQYKDDSDYVVFVLENGHLLITNDDLQRDLFTMFGVKEKDLNDVFIPFIKDVYNDKVKSVTYTTYHCNYCGHYHPVKYHIE
jgi:hypothetical protein